MLYTDAIVVDGMTYTDISVNQAEIGVEKCSAMITIRNSNMSQTTKHGLITLLPKIKYVLTSGDP